MNQASGLSRYAIGDHLMIGLRPGTTLDPEDRTLLADLNPVGVILFKHNFVHDVPYEQWLESHIKLIEDLRGAVDRDKLLIAIDHEGGRVCRTPLPITRFECAAQWAETSAFSVGQAMGLELASLGINLSFAPVLDINSNPHNPVIGDRAYGSTVEQVTESSLQHADGLRSSDILPCGKHFPGHGETTVDSHFGLPTLNLSLGELGARELLPFAEAIDHNIEMLMTAHIYFPVLDADLPATLSKKILHGILREGLGYQGVVVSDDIHMQAMQQWTQNDEVGATFLQAGGDILMVCAHWDDNQKARLYAKGIEKAIVSGNISETCLSQSKARIERLLMASKQHPVRLLSEAVLAKHQKIGAIYDKETVQVI